MNKLINLIKENLNLIALMESNIREGNMVEDSREAAKALWIETVAAKKELASNGLILA